MVGSGERHHNDGKSLLAGPGNNFKPSLRILQSLHLGSCFENCINMPPLPKFHEVRAVHTDIVF